MRMLALASMAFLAACSGPDEFAEIPQIDFANKPSINISVAEIRVVEVYKAPIEAPYVEHRFPTPPAAALKTWVGQRLRPVGNSGIFEFIIEDASVKETPLRTDDSIGGLFNNEQSEKYDARIRVVMKVYTGERALPQTQGDVTLTRTRSIAEDATVYDRELLFDEMARSMMEQFDHAAMRRLHEYFSAYIR